MSRKTSLSGFHEWLPQERLVELHVLNTLAEVFELHGFANIETRAVEPLGTLLRKGEIDKEVYTVSRIHETEAPDPTDTSRLALHFDLTVPFARYVTENAGHLPFLSGVIKSRKSGGVNGPKKAGLASSRKPISISWGTAPWISVTTSMWP